MASVPTGGRSLCELVECNEYYLRKVANRIGDTIKTQHIVDNDR